MDEEKVYIFVSHSHRDLQIVRLIRNYLENELDAEPILFFLKSKTDEDEIMQLIKDEIDARIWFIYCKSQNAENSKWVNSEREYVKETGKWNIVIDIDNCLEENGELNEVTKTKLQLITGSFRSLQSYLYISYLPEDAKIVYFVRDFLQYTYSIRTYMLSYSSVRNHEFAFDGYIKNAIRNSHFYLLFLSQHSIGSSQIKKEFKIALEYKKTIIPVIIYEDQKSFNEIKNNGLPYREINSAVCFYFDASSESIKASTYSLLHHLVELMIKEEPSNN